MAPRKGLTERLQIRQRRAGDIVEPSPMKQEACARLGHAMISEGKEHGRRAGGAGNDARADLHAPCTPALQAGDHVGKRLYGTARGCDLDLDCRVAIGVDKRVDGSDEIDHGVDRHLADEVRDRMVAVVREGRAHALLLFQEGAHPTAQRHCV